jgi:hypothetical protein
MRAESACNVTVLGVLLHLYYPEEHRNTDMQ